MTVLFVWWANERESDMCYLWRTSQVLIREWMLCPLAVSVASPPGTVTGSKDDSSIPSHLQQQSQEQCNAPAASSPHRNGQLSSKLNAPDPPPFTPHPPTHNRTRLVVSLPEVRQFEIICAPWESKSSAPFATLARARVCYFRLVVAMRMMKWEWNVCNCSWYFLSRF